MQKTLFILTILFLQFLFTTSLSFAQPDSSSLETKITMTVDSTVIHASLNNSATSKDFISRLPLSMTMRRWDDREYYGKVGNPLIDTGTKQSGYTNADIAYFVPGGSYAVFFDKAELASISELIIMGKVDSDLTIFDTFGESVEMLIELAK